MSATAELLSEGLERASSRPDIPDLLQLALLSWVSCGLAFTLLREYAGFLGAELLAALAFAAAAFAGVLALCRTRSPSTQASRKRWDRASLVLVGVLLGLAMSFAGASAFEDERKDASGFEVCRIVLMEDARVSSWGASALCRVWNEGGTSLTAHVYLPESGATLLRGDVLAVSTLASAKDEVDEYSWSNGCAARLNVSSFELIPDSGLLCIVRDLRERAITSLGDKGGEQAALMQALACGYTRGIEESGDYADCRITGLAHLIAVSGSHLALIVGLLELVLSKLGVHRLARSGLSVAFVIGYLVFAGLPVSAIRSGIMAVIGIAAPFARRRSSPLSAIGCCVLAMLALDPQSCVSASLILSAGSTLGIVLFAGLFQSWFRGAPRVAMLVEPLSLTAAASLGVQPYSCALFSQLPLLALPANVLAAPLFVPACVLSLIASLFAAFVPDVAQPVVSVAAFACLLLQLLVRTLASIPYACVAISLPVALGLLVSGVAAYALWMSWPQPSMRSLVKMFALLTAVLSIFCLVVGGIDARRDELIMFDVGQGDAVLARSDGRTLLVDTGTNDALLREGLAKARVFALDAVLITHGDDDHCGSLEALAEVVRIKRVLLARGVAECPCESCASLLARAEALRGSPEVVLLEAGDTLRVGSFAFEVVWPTAFADEGGNADSLCLLGHFAESDYSDAWEILLTGDLESAQLKEISAVQNLADIDVLKVGHHGSTAALDAQAAELLSPELALIGVGEDNRYGHPSEEVLSLLAQHGTKILRTDLHGTVCIAFSPEELTVRCFSS